MLFVEPPLTASGTRRNFFVGAIYTMWAAISGTLGLSALRYLLLPSKSQQQQDWTEVGDITRLSPGRPVEMVFQQNRVDGWRVFSQKSTAWVVRQADNTTLAFKPQCTHLGCAYHWEGSQKEFVCPCHGSVFSVDGKVVSGPASRPLDRYTTRVEGSQLYVGPSQDETEKQV